MTLQEFSDTFDTLLNSYSLQSQFGEGASKFEITLDEYEKSVLLTQAQDVIVKTYFDSRANAQGQGFDDSERRQVDFSSLIVKDSLKPVGSETSKTTLREFTFEGHSYSSSCTISTTGSWATNVSIEMTTSPTLVIPEEPGWSIVQHSNYAIKMPDTPPSDNLILKVYFSATLDEDEPSQGEVLSLNSPRYSELRNVLNGFGINVTIESNFVLPEYDDSREPQLDLSLGDLSANTFKLTGVQEETFDTRGITYLLPKDILFILNEAIEFNNGKRYVVKPITYREYDREMSKAYAQPLKKQAWRIFNNVATGYDIYSEVIMNESISNSVKVGGEVINYYYKIRYVKRPNPIVLVDLPQGLEIDGVTTATPCSLNPILHMDILNTAVQLALTTRGARSSRSESKES